MWEGAAGYSALAVDLGSGLATDGTTAKIGIFYGRSDTTSLIFVPKSMTYTTFDP